MSFLNVFENPGFYFEEKMTTEQVLTNLLSMMMKHQHKMKYRN